MIDHIGIAVTDLERAKAFFTAALAPLGISLLFEVSAAQTGAFAHAGFGAGGKAFFWIGNSPLPVGGLHAAFTGAARADVDAFYRAALAAGGTDNGPPGLRPHYHPHYYAAFVRDPDGNNIEAVCHAAG